jgi:hypothetical protein
MAILAGDGADKDYQPEREKFPSTDRTLSVIFTTRRIL